MTVAIIDYGSGNLRSAAKALERVSGTKNVIVTADPKDVLAADHIVLPGVGAFGDCRSGLYSIEGMVEALEQAVITDGKPFLGICVGMQLMASLGIEFGEHKGLGWIDGVVKGIEVSDPKLKIPHMGWNSLKLLSSGEDHPVLKDIGGDDHAYFVHSYACFPTNKEHILVETNYETPITAVIGRDNLIGTQFHPEKSQAVGLRLLEKFLLWRP
jgi:imidazole glycerol-phosphate synthase subunit HisH